MTLTGHAHHFLSRLDRLSVPHLDVALSLYRDDELLRHILHTARVPEGVERVALSLSDPARGPFLIVTRGGKFVTCLGQGMVTRDLPVIPREKLDAITQNVTTWRERTSRAMSQRDNAAPLMRALYERAQWLTREQFEGIAVWQPFLALELLKWLIDEARAVETMRARLLREVPKSGKLHRRWDETLHALWCRMWTIGHLSVLAAMDSETSYQELPKSAREAIAGFTYAMPSVLQGLVGNTFRGIWGAARLGEELFAHYTKQYAAANYLVEIVDAMFSFTAMGMRYPALRAQVKEALSEGAPVVEGRSHIVVMRKLLSHILLADEKDPTDYPCRFGKVGAEMAITLGKRAPPSSPYRFENPDDVPRDLANAALLLLDTSFLADQRYINLMTMALPWLSRAKPAELYLPDDYITAVRVPYEPDHALSLLQDNRRRERLAHANEAQAQKAGPVRSAPCPCGSGKKYKRCCGDR